MSLGTRARIQRVAVPRQAPNAGLLERAGGHLVSHLAVARADERVGDVLDHMRGARLDYAGTVYLVDERGRLIGQSPLTTLLASPADRPVHELRLPSRRL